MRSWNTLTKLEMIYKCKKKKEAAYEVSKLLMSKHFYTLQHFVMCLSFSIAIKVWISNMIQ